MTFVGKSAALLGICVLAARVFGPPGEWQRGAIASAICVPLAALSLGISGAVMPRGFSWQFGAIVGGAGVRIAVVLALAGLAVFAIPACSNATFWLWTAGAYLLTLSIEIVLLIQLLKRWSEASPQVAKAAGAARNDTDL